MRIDIVEVDLFSNYLSSALKIDNLDKVHGITTDSRNVKKNDLFLAIKGENFDGSDFIDQALASGASYVITETENENDNVFTVNNVIDFIGKICSTWMRNFYGKTIAITGSNGKTTTKDLISHALIKIGYKVSKTQGNFNTSIGVPMTVFSFSHDPSQIYVLELGANQIGDINYLSSIIKPDIGIVTSISNAHLDGFKSLENIRKEKKSIFNHSVEAFNGEKIQGFDDSNFIDYSDRYLRPKNANHKFKHNSVMRKNISIAYEACKKLMDKYYHKELRSKYYTDSHESYNDKFERNEVMKSIIEKYKRIEFLKLIDDFVLPTGRGEIYHISGDNKHIYLCDSTYNANPDSVKAAIDIFMERFFMYSGRRIFIFGDMKELGRNEINFHNEIGDYCESKFDIIICYGELAKYTYKNSKSSPLRLHFDNIEQLVDELFNLLDNSGPQDIFNSDKILLKGSRSMQLDVVVEKIKKYSEKNGFEIGLE